MDPTIKFAGHRDRFRHPEAIHTHIETPQAGLAVRICGNIAIAMGTPDGEDSAGRAKYKLMPADEVAERACAIAAAMFAQWAKRGWLVEVPPDEPADKKPEDAG
jgi:hypothetical protein